MVDSITWSKKGSQFMKSRNKANYISQVNYITDCTKHNRIEKHTRFEVTNRTEMWRTRVPSRGVPCWVWRSCILMSSMWLVIHCDFSSNSINWALSWAQRSTCRKQQTTGHHAAVTVCVTGKTTIPKVRQTLMRGEKKNKEKQLTT